MMPDYSGIKVLKLYRYSVEKSSRKHFRTMLIGMDSYVRGMRPPHKFHINCLQTDPPEHFIRMVSRSFFSTGFAM
jgi:hypothetical protein